MIDMVEQKIATEIIVEIFQHLADWPIKSTEAFRNCILGEGLLAFNPLLDIHEEHEVEYVKSMIRRTVAEGRMIDFGFIPNDVLKPESVRSRHMFELGEFTHPYDDWVAIASWEGGLNAYHISPHPSYAGYILVIEMYGVHLPGLGDATLIYDLVAINVIGLDNTIVAPYASRYPNGEMETDVEMRARGANSLDPLVTFLRILADASIPIEHREAPERLNRARAKAGKWAIPGHTIVHTKDYVSQFTSAPGTRGSASGGTHASPIAHWRRSHLRHLSDGKVVQVRASKINWRDTEELHRLFYRIDKGVRVTDGDSAGDPSKGKLWKPGMNDDGD
jgi:hypothetical protein